MRTALLLQPIVRPMNCRGFMQKNKGGLPPLGYFQAFEVSAKNESFAIASRELGVSESAVSRKVRLLEQFYEIPLFERGHKSIALTHQGGALYKKIVPALEILRDASGKLMAQHNHSEVNIAATNSVASLWLMPRLQKFGQANKQINIMMVASDDDQECLADEIDLSILRGDGNWPGYTSRKLFGEIIFPVCSPEFLSKNPQSVEIKSLLKLPLIEVSNYHSEWMNWSTFLHNHLPEVPEINTFTVFNAYPHAIQATVDGMGIALGWGHLVDHLLKKGALVRPLNSIQTRTEFGYYLMRKIECQDHPERDIVEKWLLSESAARNSYPVTA